ncbi:hypothetical protein BH11VER1_BH11VER1_04120 [soil metagenome]
MTKILFMLSAVVMAFACFFSYMNRENFIKTRLERHETDGQIGKELTKLTTLAGEIVELKGKISVTNDELATETERLNQAKIKLRNAVGESERTQSDLEKNKAEFAEYKKQLEALPQGVSIETINEDINKLKQGIATAEGEAQKIGEQVTGKEAEIKRAQGQLEDVIERIAARKKSFERNSLTATVVAVNNDWGFVVIDGGQNKGITADTKLLVTRGDQTIGKLNILTIETSKTIANIDIKSLRSGLVIAPGDRVVLEDLYQ